MDVHSNLKDEWRGYVRHLFSSFSVNPADIRTFANAYALRAKDLYRSRHWDHAPRMMTVLGGVDGADEPNVHFEILLNAFPAIRQFVNFPGTEAEAVKRRLQLTLQDFGRMELTYFVAYAYLGAEGLHVATAYVVTRDSGGTGVTNIKETTRVEGLLNLLAIMREWEDKLWVKGAPILDDIKLAIMDYLRRIRGHTVIAKLVKFIRSSRESILRVQERDQRDIFRAMFRTVAELKNMTTKAVRYGFDLFVNAESSTELSGIHWGFDFLLKGPQLHRGWPKRPDLNEFRQWVENHRGELREIPDIGKRDIDVEAFVVLAQVSGVTPRGISRGFSSIVRNLDWTVDSDTGWPFSVVFAEEEEEEGEADLFLPSRARRVRRRTRRRTGISAAWIPLAATHEMRSDE